MSKILRGLDVKIRKERIGDGDMDLLFQIHMLNVKQRKGIAFQKEEKEMAKAVSRCPSSLYKLKLIDILALEREDWSYNILKFLIHDTDERVAEKAVDATAVFQRETDFHGMFEEAIEENSLIKAWIAMITGYIGWARDINNEIFMERLEQLLDMSKGCYTSFYIYRWMFLLTENDVYLQEILSGIEHNDHEVRYHALYVIDGILESKKLKQEQRKEIRKKLYINLGQEIRYCRIYRERILRFINQQLKEDQREWLYPKEKCFYQKALQKVRGQTAAETLIVWAIFKIYYPTEDATGEILELFYQSPECWKDPNFLIFAAYVESMYGEKMENVFLEKLKTLNLPEEQKAIVSLLQAIREIEAAPEDYVNPKALKFAEETIQYSNMIPRAYEIAAQFTSAETDQYHKMQEKGKKFKRRITMEEIEQWPLEKLYSFDTFLEMTILHRIEEPEDFMLRNIIF